MVDLGVGLNLAALDFDKDDTPELGVGLVISAFRDILQAGVGYDVGEAQTYGSSEYGCQCRPGDRSTRLAASSRRQAQAGATVKGIDEAQRVVFREEQATHAEECFAR